MRIGVLGGPTDAAGAVTPRAARALGAELGRRCWGLVAALPGPLGTEVAAATGPAGVEVVEVLARGAETAFAGADRRWVADPRARTATVRALADGVVVLPGGVDVLAMLLDLVTEEALGLAMKPFGVLDPGGVLDPLDEQLDLLTRSGEPAAPLLRESEPARLADRMAAWRPPGWREVRDEVAWVHVEEGALALVPGPDGMALPGGVRQPGEGSRAALCRILRTPVPCVPQDLRLVASLAVPGPDGVLRRVSCYRSRVPRPAPVGAVRRTLGDSGGCDPTGAALQHLLAGGVGL